MDIVDQVPRVLLIIAGVFVVTLVSSLYMFDHHSDRTGLYQATQLYKSQIVELEANNSQQKALIAAVEIEKEKIIAAYRFVEKRDELQEEVNKLTIEKKDLIEGFYSSVLNVRDSAKGAFIPQLELKNNKVLYEANVTKVDSTGIGTIHRGGITRIPFSEMTESMLSRFRPDIEEAYKKLQTPKVADDSINPTDNSMPVSAATVDTKISAEESLEFLKCQSQLSFIDTQISQLEAEKQRYLEKANSYRSRSTESSSRSVSGSVSGSKIHSNPAQASGAERSAKAIDSQIYPLRVLQSQLQLKLKILSR